MGSNTSARQRRLYPIAGVRLAIGWDLVRLRGRIGPAPDLEGYTTSPDPARRGPAAQAAFAAQCNHKYRARLYARGPICCAACGLAFRNVGEAKR